MSIFIFQKKKKYCHKAYKISVKGPDSAPLSKIIE